VEFDADQVFRSPYHRAPDALSGNQKCKLRRDADRADHLKRRASLGLVTNATGCFALAELDASGLHGPTLGRVVPGPNWDGQSARLAATLDLFRSPAMKLAC
jgi:hypothetical protein